MSQLSTNDRFLGISEQPCRRILLLSASVGAGHMRAAQAVQAALAKMLPCAVIQHVDVLNFTNPIFRRVYGRGYFDLVRTAPHLVAHLYDSLDRPQTRTRQTARLWMERLNFRRLIRLLTRVGDRPWDLVICTHFLPASIIALLKRRGRVNWPHVTVTTDMDTHRLWVNEPCDLYFTATQEARANLIGCGVAPDKVCVSGIPIDPVFSEHRDRDECRARHDLSRDGRPLLLQLAGGFGIGRIESIYQSLLAIPRPLQLVVVTGKNVAARQSLSELPVPQRHSVRVLGFTERMDELMAAADVVISKPGGLTTSEALARGSAMVVIDPIPGQEDRNCDFLLENGCALKVNNLASLEQKISNLLGDPHRLRQMRLAARAAAHPFAAFDVAEKSLALIPARSASVAHLPARRWRIWRPKLQPLG